MEFLIENKWMAISLGLFFGIGYFLYFLSFAVPMKQYKVEKSRASDYWMIPFTFAFVLLYDGTVASWVNEAIGSTSFAPISGSLDFFLTQNQWLKLLAYLVVSDFLGYWFHYFMHSKIGWDFHAYHHSPKHLTFISGLKGSPVHLFLSLFPNTVVSCIVLVDLGPEAAILKMAIEHGSIHMTHSNIHIPGARYIEYLFVTPRMHFAHHHPNELYTNSNYSFIFSIWDRIFGTYTDPDKILKDQVGLLGIDYERNTVSLFTGLPIHPRIYPEADKKIKAA